VPDDGFGSPSVPAAAAPDPAQAAVSPVACEMPGPEPGRVAMAAEPADSSAYRPAHAEAAKAFDVATTRRRPVVFEEDDDLDVPDFLK